MTKFQRKYFSSALIIVVLLLSHQINSIEAKRRGKMRGFRMSSSESRYIHLMKTKYYNNLKGIEILMSSYLVLVIFVHLPPLGLVS